LLCDPALQGRIGNAGRCRVEQEYHWATVYRRWDAVYAAARAKAECRP
jgi:hypothetical protein